MEANGKLREEEFLEHCFVLLSKFLLDKLKEIVVCVWFINMCSQKFCNPNISHNFNLYY